MFYCCILSYFYPRILFYRLYIYICLLFLFVVVSCFEFCFEFYCFCLFLLVSFFTLLGPFANPIFKPKNQKPNAHVQTNTALVRPTPCCTARQTATGQLAFSFLLPRRRAPHALHSSCMRFCFFRAQTDDPTLHDSIRSARKSRHGLTCMQFPFTLHTSAASIAQPSSLHAGSPWPPHVATLQHTGLFPPRGRRLHVILHSHAAKVSC